MLGQRVSEQRPNQKRREPAEQQAGDDPQPAAQQGSRLAAHVRGRALDQRHAPVGRLSQSAGAPQRAVRTAAVEQTPAARGLPCDSFQGVGRGLDRLGIGQFGFRVVHDRVLIPRAPAGKPGAAGGAPRVPGERDLSILRTSDPAGQGGVRPDCDRSRKPSREGRSDGWEHASAATCLLSRNPSRFPRVKPAAIPRPVCATSPSVGCGLPP